jgi:hypothetical protein
MMKPPKPTPDFPLFAHNNGQWVKKIKGKLQYFGPWADPQGALERYQSKLPSVSAPSRSVKAGRPKKPHKAYPLYAHASGRWAKKVNGKLRYFGTWADPQGALETWLAQKDDLLAGREPSVPSDGLTVFNLVNACLESKELAVATGELSQRSWNDYHAVGGVIIKTFGEKRAVTDLRPADFEKLKKEFTKGVGKKRRGHGLVSLLNDIVRVKVIFNYAVKQGLIDRLGRTSPRHYNGRFNRKWLASESELRCYIRQAKSWRLPSLFCGCFPRLPGQWPEKRSAQSPSASTECCSSLACSRFMGW